ncbi:MAG: uncharacterized protein QG577_603 [Thermodesulfobacteriota bacterium]|nr:uncharacterized protein [Thermodesulfobacteriota bacterium]
MLQVHNGDTSSGDCGLQVPEKPEIPSKSGSSNESSKTRVGSLSHLRKWLFNNFLEPLVKSRNPPRYDAASVAIGLIIGFVIPVGGQLLILAFLRFLFSFNYLVAAGFTLVSNPFNMIPLYYGYYCLGSYVLCRSINLHFERFEKLMTPVMDKSYFWEALVAFAELGSDLLLRWFVAAVLLATVFGFLGYFITLNIQKRRCKAAAARLGMRYEEFLIRLQEKAGSFERVEDSVTQFGDKPTL